MASPPNTTNITPPRVPFFDPVSGLISREWYRFLLNLFNITGAGTGVTPVINGGTGVATIPANGELLIGNGSGYTVHTLNNGQNITVTNGVGTIEIALSGIVPIANGGTATNSVPGLGALLIGDGTSYQVQNLTSGQNILITNGAGSIAIALTGIVPIANGGTNGTATPTAGAVPYGTGTAFGFTAAGTSGQVLTSAGAGTPTWTTPTTGTVTSVGQTFTGGLISVTGSPVTGSGTLALTVAGTSGGVPYFSSASTWASSAALAANALVIGGGAGVAPATTTTGTGVVTALGVNTGTAGAFVVNGGALGTPSSGTVTNLTGTASININGTVGATTPTTGVFTTLIANTSAGVGAIAPTATNFYNAKNITGAVTANANNTVATVQSDVTTQARGYVTNIGTAASAFTLASLRHFYATQATIGASSAVTNQYGFLSENTLIGATNNYGFFANNTAAITTGTAYGFYSSVNTATGGGTTYAFYSAGTAPSVFTGNVSIGTTGSSARVTARSDSSGAVSDVMLLQNNTSTTINTGVALYFDPNGSGTGRAASVQSVQSTSGNYADLRFFTANATTPAERMRISAAGNVGISQTSPTSNLDVNGSVAFRAPSLVNAATYATATTDVSLRFTTTACMVTLPAAASFSGRILYLNNVTAIAVTSSANNVIPLGSNTAGTAILAATAGKFAMIQSDGTNWITMMAN